MDTRIHIKLGFKQDGVFFGWHEGKLYQLPYMKEGRYYPLREIKAKKVKTGWKYWHIRRKKVGVEKLRAMLQNVIWEVPIPEKLI